MAYIVNNKQNRIIFIGKIQLNPDINLVTDEEYKSIKKYEKNFRFDITKAELKSKKDVLKILAKTTNKATAKIIKNKFADLLNEEEKAGDSK